MVSVVFLGFMAQNIYYFNVFMMVFRFWGKDIIYFMVYGVVLVTIKGNISILTLR